MMNSAQEKTRLWFNTENPALGGLTPAIFISMGNVRKLREFITRTLEEESGMRGFL